MADGGARSARLLAREVSKRFGSTQALLGASIEVMPGELVGLAGYNGAGKSTLLRSVAGIIRPDQGHIEVDGIAVRHGLSAKQARSLGIHTVHQELSLCPSLRVDESAAVVDRTAGGMRWRRRAWRGLASMLDEIFPGHGISPSQRIADLSIARRQMVEIASAALPGDSGVKLLILDEPTSSLGADNTENLYRWLRAKTDDGLSAIVTTHRLGEMLSHVDRLYVMRDGRVIAEEPVTTLSRERLVELMGGAATGAANSAAGEPGRGGPAPVAPDDGSSSQVRVAIHGLSNAGLHDVSLEVRAGEIVGLAGLEGHGQQAILEAVFRAATSGRVAGDGRAVSIGGKVAYVSGDRAVAGIFKYWSVAENISLSSLARLTRWGFLSRGAEKKMVDSWSHRLEIRGNTAAPILSLSGGNQQKALVARAIATGADILLLDDPTRGVDQGTKEQLHTILRDQAATGRCVIWYSTENEELTRCDRLYVLRAGQIVETLAGSDRDEAQIIAASFRPVGSS